MASSREYLDYVLEQCPEGVTFRAMMGEYVLYNQGKVFGGVYDDRFLVKPTKSAIAMMPQAPLELPYEDAKPMLLVDALDDRQFLAKLLQAMCLELPEKKQRPAKK